MSLARIEGYLAADTQQALEEVDLLLTDITYFIE
jgi:hypothetical protein